MLPQQALGQLASYHQVPNNLLGTLASSTAPLGGDVFTHEPRMLGASLIRPCYPIAATGLSCESFPEWPAEAMEDKQQLPFQQATQHQNGPLASVSYFHGDLALLG